MPDEVVATALVAGSYGLGFFVGGATASSGLDGGGGARWRPCECFGRGRWHMFVGAEKKTLASGARR